jgi:hypothetical protein
MKYIKVIIFLFVTNYSYGQNSGYTTSNLSLSLIEPGVGFEYAFGSKSSIRFRSAITSIAGLYKQQVFGMEDYFVSFTFHPISSLAIRNYYNIEKRDYNGYRTDYNSANYFSLSAIYLFQNINNPTESNVLPPIGGFIPSFLWGAQRSFGNRLFFDLNFGPGYHINERKFMPMGELSLGIHL